MSWIRGIGAACFALAMLAGCGSSSTQSLAASGSTGAFGIVTVDGKQKMYLPLPYGSVTSGNGAIAVVDVGVKGKGTQGANALITTIDLGVPDLPTTTGGDSSVIVAAGTGTKKVWLIDPHTDKVLRTVTLPDSYGQSGFSGGGGFVTGIAIDSNLHHAILSVWNGFALMDTRNGEITQVIQAAPSENFGFDSVHQRILAPFYACNSSVDASGQPPAICGSYTDPSGAPMYEGLNVIDLVTGTVYTFEDPNYGPASGGPSGASPNAPVDSEPDGAAVNPQTGVVVVASEGEMNKHVIDLQSATFDAAKKQLTAPQKVFPDQYARLTGVSIEPTKNLAFFEEEFGQSVGVLDLNNAFNGKGQVVVGTMPDLPDGTPWSNLGDPHGIAVTTGINDGKSVGFVVTDNGSWVARVDLEKFAGLNGTRAAVDPATMASAVTYLKVQ